jgi:hypothetical protein
MTAASRPLATAPRGARFASGLLLCYTASWDTTVGKTRPDAIDSRAMTLFLGPIPYEVKYALSQKLCRSLVFASLPHCLNRPSASTLSLPDAESRDIDGPR